MLSIGDYKQKYGSLSNAKVHELAKIDSEFRSETEALYRQGYREELNKSCSECWVDAYVLLMKAAPEKFGKAKERAFELRAGALLLDINGGDSTKMCTRVNLTDELALFHLKADPRNIEYFSRYPDNWKELAAAYGTKKKSGGKK